MSRKFTTYLSVVLLLLCRSSLYAQTNTALSFNSATHDYATTNSAIPIDGDYTTGYTLEIWAYVAVSEAGLHSFISEGFSGSQFAIGYNGANNHLYLGDIWGSGDVSANLPIGQWNFIAITQDMFGVATAYLNGVQIDQISDGSFFIFPSGTQLQFGTDVDNSTWFTGAIDNLRYWHALRTPAQIKQDMYGTINASDPDLLVNYLFDDPNATVNSGTTVGADFTLSGATTFTSPIQPGNNGIRFSSTGNTKITAPGIGTLNNSAGTIEAYVNPTTVNGTILNLGSDLNHTRFSIHLDNTGVPATHSIGIRNSLAPNTIQSIPYPLGFTAGQWYELAFVTDHDLTNFIDTTGVYVNGNYAGKISTGYDTGPTAGLQLTIGANGIDNTENWDGSIDEVRIWSVPLTQTDIVNNMVATLTGSETNLVALYSFDQGIPDGTNTGMTLAIDNAPPTNNATLSNFSLASTGSNFTQHVMVPLPLTLLQFTATKQSNTAVLQWVTGTEQNTRDFVIERSNNSSEYDAIGTVAAAGTSHTKRYYYFTDVAPLEGKNYYRLKESDLDGKITYSPIKVLSFTMAGNLIWYSTGTNAAEVRLHNGNNEPYTITDMAGTLIRTGRLSSGVTALSQMPSGVYFVKVVTNAGNEITVKVLLR
ncbi:MAG TPA: LamG-like jellyroll fold domain-containing protein [Puia sp.]